MLELLETVSEEGVRLDKRKRLTVLASCAG